MLFLVHMKTCIVSFLTNIGSLIGLAEKLLPEQRYLLTYKLSDDHLELLFNSERRSSKCSFFVI